jgi:hypothetical protein
MRIAFWDIVTALMEAVRTSETSVYFNKTGALYPRRLSSSEILTFHVKNV